MNLENETLIEKLAPDSEKYGVPVTFRMSAEMKNILGNEAAIRGISLAQHGTNLLLTCHQKSSERTAEINLLLQERENLKRKLEALEKERIVFNANEGRIIETLRKNQRILKHYQQNKSLTRSILTDAGFDFFFATHTGMEGENQYFCVFDMSYRIEGVNVIIKPLS